jgi:hypothetical protein
MLAALGMLISTYLCVQDELKRGKLNVVTLINNEDSDYFKSEDLSPKTVEPPHELINVAALEKQESPQ